MKLRIFSYLILLSCLLIITTPVQATEKSEYVVQPGDTLFAISLRYGMNVQTLASANGLTINSWIYTGQRLTIPGIDTSSPISAPQTSGNIYVVQQGDTLITIAVRYGISTGQLASANGLSWNSWVYAGQRLAIPDSNASLPVITQPAQIPSNGTHIVQAGENLFRIGLKYGTTAAAIRAANGLSSDVIYVGQRLRVPNSASPTTPAPSVPVNNTGASGEKWIDVNLSTQTITAYQGQTPVYSALVSTGLWGTPTVVGTFSIYAKYASTPMSGPGYYLPNVPNTMYFHKGYAIHGAYWHNNFGTPMSHGCVNLSLPDAEWFYNWAPLGTKVVTHY